MSLADLLSLVSYALFLNAIDTFPQVSEQYVIIPFASALRAFECRPYCDWGACPRWTGRLGTNNEMFCFKFFRKT